MLRNSRRVGTPARRSSLPRRDQRANVLRQLGINGILDDQTVADRDAVDKLNSMITAAAQRCNALLKARIKPTGDAKCLSYILKALVGATFSRDSTEKGFQIVLCDRTTAIAASLVEPVSDDALAELLDAMDDA